MEINVLPIKLTTNGDFKGCFFAPEQLWIQGAFIFGIIT